MKFHFPILFLPLIFLFLTGCQEGKKTDFSTDSNSASAPREPLPPETFEDAYFICYASSIHVGRETRKTFRFQDGKLNVADYSELDLNRYGKNVTARVVHSENLASSGALLDFRTQLEMGGAPMIYEAGAPKLDGRKLMLEVKVQSQNMVQTQNVETILPEGASLAEVYGGYGLETSLICHPIKLGETRRFVRLNPTMLRWESVRLEAKASEDVRLPSGSVFPLLRVETHARMLQCDGTPDPTQAQTEILWCDGKGRVWKRFSPLMNLAAWRSSKAEIEQYSKMGHYPPAPSPLQSAEVAQNKPAEATGGQNESVEAARGSENLLDFAENLNVSLKLTGGKKADFIEDAEGTYVVSSVGSGAERTPIRGLFESSGFQKVEVVDDFHLRITVRKSTGECFTEIPVTAPTRDEKSPGPMIQSDAPQITTLAQTVLPDETDAARLAPALERFVHEFIVNKNYSRGFVTALEVATNPSGDCTEHAVLLCALARNRGIPARIAQGLIFEKNSGKMAWHVWNELWVNDRWLPFDATLGRGFVGVNHLRINAGSFSVTTLAQTLLSAAKLIGKIEIELGGETQ